MTRFLGVVARVPGYVRLGWLLLRDPRISARGKAPLAGALGYAISPIDALPGIIPVLGQLDDLGILLLGLRAALRGAPPDVAAEHLRATGLSFEALDRDLTTVRVTAVWVAERAGALAARAVKAALRAALASLRGEGGADRAAQGAPPDPADARHVASTVRDAAPSADAPAEAAPPKRARTRARPAP
jgi:uncharacterized membrane protein YkvA (DUF1232 family)